MRDARFLPIVSVGLAAVLIQLAATSVEAVQIKMLSCAREAATKEHAVASGLCRSQAGARSSGSAREQIYIVTLSPEESRDPKQNPLQIAEREMQRQGLCRSGLDLVDRGDGTQFAVRCAGNRSQ